MYNSIKKRVETRKKRALRVRKRVRGTSERPRLSVEKTNQHIYAQLIDDEKQITIAGIGTMSKEMRGSEHSKKSKEAARQLGKRLAEMAQEKQIKFAVFDRGRFKFHGIISELATAAREAGLQF